MIIHHGYPSIPLYHPIHDDLCGPLPASPTQRSAKDRSPRSRATSAKTEVFVSVGQEPDLKCIHEVFDIIGTREHSRGAPTDDAGPR
jgi:hypothetical protein